MQMKFVVPGIAAIEEEMIALRRRIHAFPELGYQEVMTSNLVAECLQDWGYEVSRGLGGTGVVGTLRNGAGPSLGLRAELDALPIQENTGLPHASRTKGVMHACGHDGHTAMLLAAARYLAASRAFCGTLHLIFQPAEEGLGGARKMLDDGLFERFPCDAVFAMHNVPGFPAGSFGFASGPCMASADTVTIRVIGKGGHGAMPHKAVDPVMVAASIVMALQTVVARNVNPQEVAVITVGALHAGTVDNVIPATAEMVLSVRAMRPEIRDLLELRIVELVQAQAASFNAGVEIDYKRLYPPLINHSGETELARQVALDWVGAKWVHDMPPLTASEDFAFMLEQCPGSYVSIGNGPGEGGCQLHNPEYDFNDNCLALGASYWVKLTERFLELGFSQQGAMSAHRFVHCAK